MPTAPPSAPVPIASPSVEVSPLTPRAALSAAGEAARSWVEDAAPRLAGAISFSTIFSIAPMLILVVAIAGMFWGNQPDVVQARLLAELQGLVGANGADAVGAVLDNAERPGGGGLFATLAGVFTLLIGATALFAQLQDSLNVIWGVKVSPRENALWVLVRQRLLSFGMILTVCFLLLVSLVLSVAVSAASDWLGISGVLLQLVNVVVSLGIITLLFALIYQYLPDADIAWRDVWVGAFVTAALFTLGKLGIGLYLGNSSTASTYGAAGSFVVLLLWIYYSVMILLYGAEVTKVFATRFGRGIRPNENAVRVVTETVEVNETLVRHASKEEEKALVQRAAAPLAAPSGPLRATSKPGLFRRHDAGAGGLSGGPHDEAPLNAGSWIVVRRQHSAGRAGGVPLTTNNERRTTNPSRCPPLAALPRATRAAPPAAPASTTARMRRQACAASRTAPASAMWTQRAVRCVTRATLARIRALAIPPAYTDVWICPDPQGHLQATGRDARGRKQYRYHADWHAVRGETKYHRLARFGEALPALRRRVDEDLRARTLTRAKVIAAVVTLLEHSGERIGSAEYARTNQTYGLSTLRDRHAKIDGTTLRLRFKGKHGLAREVTLRDRRLARIVQQCRDLPGQPLFQYDTDAGPHPITSSDVNAYLREATGEAYTAKDFRTWNGTLAAARYLAAHPCESDTQAARQRHLKALCEAVAAELGNTVAVCRKHYIHPALFDAFEAGTFEARWAQGARRRAPACARRRRGGARRACSPERSGQRQAEHPAVRLRKAHAAQVGRVLGAAGRAQDLGDAACAEKVGLLVKEKVAGLEVAVGRDHEVEFGHEGVRAAPLGDEHAGGHEVAEHEERQVLRGGREHEVGPEALDVGAVVVEEVGQVVGVGADFEDAEVLLRAQHPGEVVQVDADDDRVDRRHRVGADQEAVRRKGRRADQVDDAQSQQRAHHERDRDERRGDVAEQFEEGVRGHSRSQPRRGRPCAAAARPEALRTQASRPGVRPAPQGRDACARSAAASAGWSRSRAKSSNVKPGATLHAASV